jgi:TolB protein
MNCLSRSAAFALMVVGLALPAYAHAQDTTFRGITLGGNYDASRDKVGIVVLPVGGAFGDSVRAIVQRDLDFSDRFNVVPIESADPAALRNPAVSGGLDYPIFARLGAAAVVQVTLVGSGLHISLHDVARAQVVNVAELALPSAGLGREWRLAVHRASDEIERWVTGQRGIAATRIAYLRGQSIRMIDSDGAVEITVPTDENGFSPAWSPTGSMLAYNTYGNVASRIVLIDLSTGRSRTLATAPVNSQFITPVFSPDGESVVFSRSGENGSDIFSIGVDGGATPRRLSAGQGTDNTSPTLSPNGRRIVFMTGRLGHPELYIMDADGTNVGQLTEYDFSDKNFRADPDWSPDGRLIAYQERIRGRFQISTIRAAGGTPKVLTSEGENEQPSWAPDSRHLVFTSTRTGARQLWILDTESGRLRQLSKSAGSRLGAWSPRLAGQ